MEELCILLNRLASVVIVNAKKLSLLSCLEGNVGAHLTTAARQVSIAVNELGRNIEQSDELNADSAASSAGAGGAAEDRTSKTKRLIMASNRQLKLLVLELLRLLKRCIINPYDDAVRRELKEQADSICSLACGILSSLHVLLASSLEESQLLNLCALISCDIALLVDATTVVNDQRLRQDAEIELETSVQDLSGFLPTPVIETIVTLQNELIDTARRVGAAAASPDALQSVVTAFEARLSSFASGSPAPAASPNNNNNSSSSSSSNTATSPNSGNASPLTTSGSSKLSSKKRSEGSLQLSSSASSASSASSSSSSGFSSAPGPAGTGSLTKTMSSDKNPSSPATPKRSASSRGPSSSADADNEDNSDGKSTEEMTIDDPTLAIEDAMREDAQTVVELFRDHFAGFRAEWDKGSEADKVQFLQQLLEHMDNMLTRDKAHEHGKSQQLENIIRERGMGDLGRVTQLLPQIVGTGSGASSVHHILLRVAESTMDLIIHANTSVIKPNSPHQALQQSVESLLLVLTDALRTVPTSIAQEETPVVKEHIETAIESILAIKSSDSLFKPDQNVIKAAQRGQEAKLTLYTLKKTLWEKCNSLRILTLYLLCSLRGAWDSNKTSRSLLIQLPATTVTLAEAVSSLIGTVETTQRLMEIADAARDTGAQVVDEHAEDQHIWQEFFKEKEEQLAEQAVGVEHGSLNLLVVALTSDKNYDNNFISTFITTYRSFTSPRKLFSKLLERFEAPEVALADRSRATAIQWRVAVVIKHWVETQFYDFDDDLIKELFRFVEKTLYNAGHTAMATALHDRLSNKAEDRNKRVQAMITVPPTDLLIPRDVFNPAMFVLDLTDEEIARQLTLIDYDIYAGIQVQELLQTAWNSDKLRHRSPHVCGLLNRLNKLAFFVPSLILWLDSKSLRAKMIEKFIRIAQLLRDMNNFNTLMGIVSGLNVSSVTRLRFTMAEVDQKLVAQFKRLEATMDPSSSFKNYRRAVRSAPMPALPYLGVYLTDLTFIEDGNPDLIGEEINFQKRKMVFKVIQEVLLYQQRPYMIPVLEPVRTFLTEFPFVGEKDLYNLSLRHEPRNALPNQIK